MTLTEKARMLRAYIEESSQHLNDEKSIKAQDLFPIWKPNQQYTAGYKLRHKGTLYRVLQDHMSQESWEPDKSPSLFAEVLIPDAEKIYPWKQPDSTNPYMKGDKVLWNGEIYESLIDGNIWSPEGYPAGWRKVS